MDSENINDMIDINDANDENRNSGDLDDAEIDDTSSNKSVSEGFKTSNVWKYFTKDANFKQNKKAKCNICGITYTCTGGSTTNLNKHIKNKHFGGERNQETSIKDIFEVTPKVNTKY
jgi:hypothetical protein